RLSEALGAARVLSLPAAPDRPAIVARDRTLEPALFGEHATAHELARRFAAGERVHVCAPGAALDGHALPLAVVRESRRNGALAVRPLTAGNGAAADVERHPARSGDLLLALGSGP
ncbi:MAG TPA: hypothetical protein VGM91_07545, partial [Conexibacter sp.]